MYVEYFALWNKKGKEKIKEKKGKKCAYVCLEIQIANRWWWLSMKGRKFEGKAVEGTLWNI